MRPVALPVACSLDALELGERRLEWRHLIDTALRERAMTSTGVRLSFASPRGLERSLRELVELERRCCAFAHWTISRDGSDVVLTVDGQGAGVDAIQQLFTG